MPVERPPLESPGEDKTLRGFLREATAAEHDRLDRSINALDFAERDDYARFLRMQLMARRPIEDWLARHAPAGPPPQAPLIAADLAALGNPVAGQVAFDPPAGADPIGACWAIAGSSLGNRAMHRALLRAAAERPAPVRFLADEGMTTYWRSLKPALEEPCSAADVADAIAAARAVFATFLAAAGETLARNQGGSLQPQE